MEKDMSMNEVTRELSEVGDLFASIDQRLMEAWPRLPDDIKARLKQEGFDQKFDALKASRFFKNLADTSS